MTQPPITKDVMEIAAAIERDIPSRITGANRVFIRAVIARAIMAAKEEEREECAKIADRLNGWGADFGRNGVAEHIARVIRDQKLANNTNKD